jgi:hypothetical protein
MASSFDLLEMQLLTQSSIELRSLRKNESSVSFVQIEGIRTTKIRRFLISRQPGMLPYGDGIAKAWRCLQREVANLNASCSSCSQFASCGGGCLANKTKSGKEYYCPYNEVGK